jgi:hypothetical protein
MVAPDLAGEPLVRKRGNRNPNNHQTAAPLGSKGVSDRRGAGTATQRSVGLEQAPGSGVTTPARPGHPTCGLPVVCADNPHGDHQQF